MREEMLGEAVDFLQTIDHEIESPMDHSAKGGGEFEGYARSALRITGKVSEYIYRIELSELTRTTS